MDPDILVLDEPTAGLDPKGAKDMMDLFRRINEEMHKTILVVTHDMEHVLEYCRRVIVISHGKIIQDCSVAEFFENSSQLHEMNINPPAIIRLREALQKKGFVLDNKLLSIEDLAKAVLKEVKK